MLVWMPPLIHAIRMVKVTYQPQVRRLACKQYVEEQLQQFDIDKKMTRHQGMTLAPWMTTSMSPHSEGIRRNRLCSTR